MSRCSSAPRTRGAAWIVAARAWATELLGLAEDRISVVEMPTMADRLRLLPTRPAMLSRAFPPTQRETTRTGDKEMARRSMETAHAQQQRLDDYVRSAAAGSGPAAEIDKAKQLLDSGAITQAESDSLKRKQGDAINPWVWRSSGRSRRCSRAPTPSSRPTTNGSTRHPRGRKRVVIASTAPSV